MHIFVIVLTALQVIGLVGAIKKNQALTAVVQFGLIAWGCVLIARFYGWL